MDFYKVPIGFGMALAMNANALNAYSAMTEMQKQEILDKAHHARSEREMHEIVNSIIKSVRCSSIRCTFNSNCSLVISIT